MHYLAMKVPTAQEVITIKGDQQSARGCYTVVSKVTYQIASDSPMKEYPSGIQPTPHGWYNCEAPLERCIAMEILLKDSVLTFSILLLFTFFNVLCDRPNGVPQIPYVGQLQL